jgi:hypothetical protein
MANKIHINITEKEIEAKVEEWHTKYKGFEPLHQFVGLSFDAFSAYIEGRAIFDT